MSLHPSLKHLLKIADSSVRLAEERARRCYGLALPAAAINYSLRGHCAGQALVTEDGRTFLRFNRTLLEENREDFIRQTIPHEVAHLVVNWRVRKRRQRPRPHGPEWQAVMRDCFALEPRRCHNYATTAARVVPRNFVYSCGCREHHLTSIMHNKISAHDLALCKQCRTPLRFITRRTP
jgi:SprT protein